jgi:hypothetical protein
MIQRAPRPRPSSIASRSSWPDAVGASRFRSASNTRSRPMTVSPCTFFRSALTVSAMPDPIHSSAGSRVMLVNVTTAIELSGAWAAACPWFAELRSWPPWRSISSSSVLTRCRSMNMSRAV